MRRIIALCLFIGCLCTLCGCDMTMPERAEEPHLYWKTIDAVVTNVDGKQWYASGHHYELSVTVYSEEYDLTKTITLNGGGMFAPQYWDAKKGDIVKVKLYTWKMDSTGEIVRREIHSFA